MGKQNLIYLLILCACASSCTLSQIKSSCSSKFSMVNHPIPVVSIDSLFVNQGSITWNPHAVRLTKVMTKLLDSISMDSVMRFVPNYKMETKTKSRYSVSAVLGLSSFGGKPNAVAAYKGFLTDNYQNEKVYDIGSFGQDENDIRCFSYDPSKPDSTEYHDFKINLVMGFRLKYLVPFSTILVPTNTAGKSIKVFSIDELVKVNHPDDSVIGVQLTHLLNNIFVFYQSTFKRNVYQNFAHYNYFGNYLKPKKNRKKTDYVIQSTLDRTKDGNYIMTFAFKGANINLEVPEKIKTTVVLDRARILENDYTEAMLKIGPLLNSFKLQHIAF